MKISSAQIIKCCTFKHLLLMFIFLLLAISFLPGSTYAHAPSSMDLEYDFYEQRLNVTIYHTVPSPSTHYIETVDINKNDQIYLTQDYTSQPSTSTFTYYYDVEAVDEDVLEVTAICSLSGSITEQITVEAPPTDEIFLIISPKIESIDENTEQDFTVSVYYNGELLDDVVLEIKVKYGVSSDYQRISEGQYEFTYFAPDVSRGLAEEIRITATKEGYDDGRKTIEFNIKDVAGGGETCPTLDGIIENDEYEFEAVFSNGDFKLHWRVVENTIIMGLEAKTKGWVSLGIEPSQKMKDADMIIGWVEDDGNSTVLDCYSTGEFGPHPPDTELGGTSDILCYGGSENSKTIIEFKRILSSNDDFDKDIPSDGEIKIIWATGSNDDFESQHSKRGYGTIDIATGEYSEIEVPSLWIVHAILMTVGFVLMVKAVIIAKVFKKRDWWFKTHKMLGILAAVFSVVGLLMGFYMVSASGGTHFRVPHAYVGVSTLIFVVMTPILCFALQKFKNNSSQVRALHRWFGRITFTLMLVNIIFGLMLVGII